MLNFTTQERAVIIFLTVTLLVGSGARLVKNRRLDAELGAGRSAIEAARFDSIANEINTASMTAGVAVQELEQDNSSAGTININLASASELEHLPGIGPAIAGRIVAYRDSMGAFTNIKEIAAVKGIGDKLYARIEAAISVD